MSFALIVYAKLPHKLMAFGHKCAVVGSIQPDGVQGKTADEHGRVGTSRQKSKPCGFCTWPDRRDGYMGV